MVKNYASTTSEDEFKSIFKTYYHSVVRKIMKILRDQSIAEDLAQDVFLQLYQIEWEKVENIPAWLSKTALFASYNYLRSKKREQKRNDIEYKNTQKISASAEEETMIKIDSYEVNDILKEMSERDRTILLMKFRGFSYKELAKEVKVKPSSVGKLLSRAKQDFYKLYIKSKESRI